MVGSSASSVVVVFIVLLICVGTSAQYENCTGVIEWIADGNCDWKNNDEACGFDGGDCCECTCGNDQADFTCDYVGFDCLDPNAPSALYNCEKPPASALPCGADLRTQWSVETTEDAQDLADAVYCSGGLFEVLWNGLVVVNKTILVVDRTALNISGVGLSNVIDGGGVIRVFSIINASVIMSNVDILNGNATSGGAVAASGSSLTFTRIAISGNTASINGGGMLLSDASSAVFTGETVISSNTAFWGGAIAVTNGSNISWKGGANFSQNHAYGDGGALHVWESSVVWMGTALSSNIADKHGGALFVLESTAARETETFFSNNTASSMGGALYVWESTASWTGNTAFSTNTAGFDGGAIYVGRNSISKWSGKTIFDNNTATDQSAGAVYVGSNSTAEWSGENTFSNNNAGSGGGAVAATDSTVSWAETTLFSNNTANDTGGAVKLMGSTASCVGKMVSSSNMARFAGGAFYVGLNSTMRWSGETIFTENIAFDNSAGSVCVDSNSTAICSGETMFSSNRADNGGGAVVVTDSTVSWTGNTAFSSNTANVNGGAVHLMKSMAAWVGETFFSNNTAGSDGGALYVAWVSTISWTGGTVFTGNMALDNGGGGAVYVNSNSIAAWSGDTMFSNNNASNGGGAVAVEDSSVSWFKNASFLNNTSNVNGGAVRLMNSTATWVGKTDFSNNIASFNGGALYEAWGCSISWTGETYFSNNAANQGGALYEGYESTANWLGTTIFTGNIALNDGGGGAVYVYYYSTATWSGDAMFSNNNASNGGGAVNVEDSSVSWVNSASFSNNTSNVNGGAVHLMRSTATWVGKTAFSNNTASFDGGALYAAWGCNISWTGETRLSTNGASRGGALYEGYDSIAIWSGYTTFTENTIFNRDGGGGAVYVDFNSTAKWLGNTLFTRNNAVNAGGAIKTYDSTVMWGGTMSFLANTAVNEGGALYLIDSLFTWDAKTTFSQNVAEQGSGGAAYIFRASTMEWTGQTLFSYNTAGSEGGAIEVSSNGSDSSLIINGPTTFQNNTCEGNGGGVRISGAVSLAFESTDVTFFGNIATLSGGGISINAADVGPAFKGTIFISNFAQVGGGVHVTDTPAPDSDELSTPTSFNGCVFVTNGASISGGALSSDSGVDAFINTSFVGNYAQIGGALNLAGTASLSNCSFEDNVSEVDQGPAVYNLKVITAQRFSSFVNNVFRCDSGAFLQFAKSDEIFGKVCAGCPEPCNTCYFDQWTPSCSTLSEAGIVHASSPGGDTTIESLVIEIGYWRATETSYTVLECYNEDSCPGGVTDGSCSPGYEGPYCSVCSRDYVAGLGSKCIECSDSMVKVVVDAIIVGLCMAFGVAVIRYLLSEEAEGMGRGLVDRLTRSIPLQAVKITIVSWQILTQFTSVTNVIYPDTYQRFIDGVDIFNFDLGWTMSAGCIIATDFHDRFLISTIGPIVVVMGLGITYAIAVSRHRRSQQALQNVRHKHVSTVLLLTFLVYSSASSLVFQMFDCEHLEDGKYYLRADYRIQCDSSKHRALQMFAGIMIALYPLGIPVWYAFLLFRDRGVLANRECRTNNPSVRSTSNLWKPYKPSRYFYEVVECGRRILLTGVVLMVDDGIAAKIAVTFMVALIFVFVSEALAPYESRVDAWISRAGHAVTSTSIYFALLLEVNVSEESQASQRAFEIVLVTMHVCMISSVVVESGLAVYSLRPREWNSPIRRYCGMSTRTSPV